MKGKFKFHFKDGTTIVDRNGYKTISQARSWVRGHNSGARGGSKIVRIETRKNTKRKIRRRQSNPYGIPQFKIPKFRF